MDLIERCPADLEAMLPASIAAPSGVTLRLEAVTVTGSRAYLAGRRLPPSRPRKGRRRPHRRGGAGSGTAVRPRGARLPQAPARVREWVKVTGCVNRTPGFEQTPAVVNGFSDLICDLWGDAGRHARSAIGVCALPFSVPVEVAAIVELT